MAKGGLFIGWGPAARGREQTALALFQETMQYYAGLQQQGEIDSFEPVQLEPHGGDLQGFLLLRGDTDKLARLRTSQEFISFTARATLALDNIGVTGAYFGEGLEQLFGEYGKLLGGLK
jgi:hypothetical protein